MTYIRYFVLALAMVCFSAQAIEHNDPYEKFNRKVFAFNDTLDRFLLKPIAKVYKKISPNVLNRGISNMFDNVGDVSGVINSVMQGKGGAAAKDTSRVLINSTVGVAGFFDVATKMGIDASEEDMGQTLAVWGVNSGPYIMLPFFGGRTVREAASLGVDTYLNPLSYVDHVPTKNSLRGVDVVDKRADLLDAEKLLSGDRYSLYREAYFQSRELLLNDGAVKDTFGESAFDDDIFEE